MKVNTYRVCYLCNDGKILGFNYESNRRLVLQYRNGSGPNIMTNPLLSEVWDEIRKRKENPKNKMHQHGGYKRLYSIKNVNTGTIQLYDLF